MRCAIVAIAIAAAAPAAAAAPCADGDTCFIAFGDQGTGDENQMRVARAMTRWAASQRTDFLIGLGDNFYELGVHSCDSSKFDERFEQPYRDLKKMFYMSIGNHDVFMALEAKPEHQVCYARTDSTRDQALGPRFVMPGLYYTFTRGDVQFFVVYTPGLTMQSLWLRDAEHLRWLETELARSTARWKVVYGHGPIFSYGEHGHSKLLAKKILPLLAKYRVDAYFAGHEHSQQHLVHPAYPDLELVVSGAAGKAGTESRGELTKWTRPGLGFVYATVSREKMTIQFLTVDRAGTATVAHTVSRDKQSGTAPAPPPLECAEPSQERSMGLCYPRCRAGFHGVGPVCWQACPPRYHDDGATCRRDVHITTKDHYGRGAGYVAWDRPKCERAHAQGCEQSGAMWYPKCKAGYRAVACCICREQGCPTGYRDDGATCRRDAHITGKQSYGRGVGTTF